MTQRGLWFRAAAVALGLSGTASADTDELRALLSENVITTASTVAEKASTAPATSVTITSEELRTFGIRNIAEAIDYLSVGLITSDPLGAPDVGARGVILANDDGKHFLLLVNGHAVNDPLLGAARFDEGAGIPLDVVDHIEVVIGPGSVLYGSNAMLGVVNVITKDASAYRGGHVTAELEPGRTARAGAGAGMTFRLFGAPSELTVAADYVERFGPDLDFYRQQFPVDDTQAVLRTYRRGGPADGIWGGTVKDAYFMQAPSGAIRLRSGDFELNLIGSVYRRGIPYTTQRYQVDLDDPDSYEMDRAVRADLKHHKMLGSRVELVSRVYGDSFDYQRQVNRNAIYGCFRADFATCSYYDAALARWIGLEERASLNWFGDGTFVTLIGVDARMRWVRTKEDALNFDTGEPFAPTLGLIRQSGGLVSPYLQQTWSPASWLDLNAGARLDIDGRYTPILSPRAAIAVTPFPKTTLRVINSQAFRAPTWMETDFAGHQQAGADQLRPEKVLSGEISVEQRFGSSRLLFGVYRSEWENLVELVPLGPDDIAQVQREGKLPITVVSASQYRNVSSLVNFGYNARFQGSLADGKLAYGLSLTESYSRRTADGVSAPLVVAPRLYGNAHVAYQIGPGLPVPALGVYFMAERSVDRTLSDPRYDVVPPAAPLAELRGTVTGPIPAVAGLSYRVSATYATAATGPYLAGPGLFQAAAGTTQFPMTPIDRFRFFFGLRYDFGAGDTGEGGS